MFAAVLADEADARDRYATTRENYQHFAFLLARKGHVPGAELRHLDFRVLLFLLFQKPGAYAAHHRTIARACESNVNSIRESLARLRDAGLVLWELIRPHHKLPTGRFTRTNVCLYWVAFPRLEALLEAPAGAPAAPKKCRAPAPPSDAAPTLPESGASTHPNSGASYGTTSLNEQPPPQTPPSPVPPPVSESPAGEVEAISNSSEVGSEIAPICEAWKKLGLGALDGRSVRALENRCAEGATLEQLEAAVEGAGADQADRTPHHERFAVGL
jgi:hypothetical protein